jgi:hypothetical protein
LPDISSPMPIYFRRLVGSFALDPAAFEDVEADDTATLHAGLTVLLASVAAGVGAQGFGAELWTVVPFALVTLVAWAAWALLTFEVGTRILPGSRTYADVGQLMRTMGFAAAPGLMLVLAALPGLTVPIFVMATLWMLAAMIVAVRQALDYEMTIHAVAVCIFGWGLAVALVVAVGSFLAAPVG